MQSRIGIHERFQQIRHKDQIDQMIKSIFFDFNGVIIDDEPIQLKAYQETLREHRIALTSQWYLDALGMDDRTFIRYVFKRAEQQLTSEGLEAVLAEKSRLHRQMIEAELPLFSGVITFLKSTARRYALGVVSMANTTEVAYVLRRAKLSDLFSIVVTSNDVTACKPAPDCYHSGLEKLNEQRQQQRLLPLLPTECLAIEDSPPGIVAAKTAGMHTLGVTNTVSESELRAAEAEVVTASLADWTPDAVSLLW